MKQRKGFFRPLGEHTIHVAREALDDSARLVLASFHEIKHHAQEFSAQGWQRSVTRGFQRASAWSTKTFGETAGAFTPTYLLNPVEIHAAAAGVGATRLHPNNWANLAVLALSRIEERYIIYPVASNAMDCEK